MRDGVQHDHPRRDVALPAAPISNDLSVSSCDSIRAALNLGPSLPRSQLDWVKLQVDTFTLDNVRRKPVALRRQRASSQEGLPFRNFEVAVFAPPEAPQDTGFAKHSDAADPFDVRRDTGVDPGVLCAEFVVLGR